MILLSRALCKSLLPFHWNYVFRDIQRQRMAWP